MVPTTFPRTQWQPLATGLHRYLLLDGAQCDAPQAVLQFLPHAASRLFDGLLADGSAIHSRITRESVQLLGLRKGLDVLALCKATAVHIDSSEGDVDGKNTLTGVVRRATRSAKGGEVSVRLPAGVQLVGFASAISPKVGQSASAQIDEAGIVIAALN